MNNDDIFNQKNRETSPDLEVRVVAWVLGEAAEAEAAELARLCAAHPALAEFKRRIEAVHGLAGKAARPAGDATLRLSDERRAKVLAVIGGEGAEETAEAATNEVPRWVRIWNQWALPAAACITLCVLLGAVMFPAIGASKKAAYRGMGKKAFFEAAPERPEPSMTVLGVANTTVSEVGDSDVRGTNGPMVTFSAAPAVESRRIVAATSAVGSDEFAPTVTTMPVPAPKAAPVSQLGRDRSLGIGGANSYTGATAVTSGTMAVDALKQNEALSYSDSSRLVGEKHRQFAANKEAEPLDLAGVAVSAPAMPTEVAASRGNDFSASGRASSSSLAMNADTDQFQGKFGASRLNASAGKDQRMVVGGFVSSDKTPVLGDVPFEGRLFKKSEEVDNDLKPDTMAGARLPQSDGVATGAGQPSVLSSSRVSVGSDILNEKSKGKQVAGDLAKASEETRYRKILRREAEQKNQDLADDAPVARKPEQPDFDESLRHETATNQQAVSTFSLHVSDASFRLAKAALARGEAPDPASIRPEEFYNAFDYGDPSPAAGEPVACRIEQSAHPFLQQRNLVRIAMKVPATGRGAGQPLRLTVLLDTSGSMERPDRAASVRAALTALVSLLGPDDRITLVGFARQPHLLADRVPGNQAAGLADLVAKTPFEGGTNLEEALKLAGNLARGQLLASAQNRIVLLTDGAANLGEDDPARLAAMITALRQQGIAFDACGVVADGLDDTILEALTRKGDGRYMVINSAEEADENFAHQLAGAFRPAAQNVKVQVHFNPARVARYRLIGFEQHRLKTEDFRNDRVDAAELAAEEAAVALYQVEVLPDGEGELGEVAVRFRDAATGEMVERSWTLAYAPQPPAFDRATPSMKLAGTAAFLAEKLRGGELAGQIHLAELAPVVNELRGDYAHDARVQDFVTMFAQARRLTGE